MASPSSSAPARAESAGAGFRLPADSAERPSHHTDDGFTNPWPTFQPPTRADLLKWRKERQNRTLPPDLRADEVARAIPDLSLARLAPTETAATWIGHSSWLVQIGAMNILLDPHWSDRASPVQWAGPRRVSAPGVEFEALPPIDLVLLSHDHFDHLDVGTVDRIQQAWPAARWGAPLGHAAWFARRGIEIIELDWWQTERVSNPAQGGLEVLCLPAQHWTSRSPWVRMKRLWCSWAIASHSHRVYFGGDSGWFPEYGEIGRRAGPFDLSLLPIGAYEPRWFMRSSHMNPEEAVQAYRELGGRGVFAGMHWGTFRLTDEDPREPPVRTQRVWSEAGLPADLLWIPRLGETRRLRERNL